MKVLLLLVTALTTSLLTLEIGLRSLGLGPRAPLTEFHEKLGWANRVNASVQRTTPEFDVTFEFNALGLRDDADLTVAKPAGTFRVVALGDSFVLGHSVARSDLFVDLLEERWRAAGLPIQVVNAGAEGYSTDQQALWVIENGAAFAPDLVLLFPYENDLYWNGQDRYGRYEKPRIRADGTPETRSLAEPPARGLFGNTAIGSLPFFVGSAGFETFQPGERKILREHAPLLEDPPDFIEDALGRSRGALLALARACAAIGAELVVIPIPSHSAIDAEYREQVLERELGLEGVRWSPDRPVDLVLEAARSAGIRTLDPRSYLRGRAGEGAALYFEKDWHLDPSGNRALADFLERELGELDLLPQA